MSFFSKFFPSGNERRVKRILDQSAKEVELEIKPMADLGKAIIGASYNSSQEMKSMLSAATESGRLEQEIYVFYEFIYFFMHLSIRQASSQLDASKIASLQEFLGPLISSTAVESFFRHWPKDLREKLIGEFYANLNDAELEYSKSNELLSEKQSLSGNSLFSILSRNIAKASGNEGNPVVMISAMKVAVDAYTEMALDSLIAGIRRLG